jgi:hypothetical protein
MADAHGLFGDQLGPHFLTPVTTARTGARRW